MSTKKSKQDRLLDLLEAMVTFYEGLLKNPAECTPADRETIRKLLNDNGIHAGLDAKGDARKLGLAGLLPEGASLPFKKEQAA